MSYMRYARKNDKSQPEAVAELRKLGYIVEIIGKPVDVMVRHHLWPENVWCVAEFKTPNAKGEVVMRKDRVDQQSFCNDHNVPYWTGIESALNYLQLATLKFSNPERAV